MSGFSSRVTRSWTIGPGEDWLSLPRRPVAAFDSGRQRVVHHELAHADLGVTRRPEDVVPLHVVRDYLHREVRRRVFPGLPHPMRHGILGTREAEIATDALRAALLESAGYEAKVFEFVSTEHTDKNLMITGVKVRDPDPAAAEARGLAAFYRVHHQRLADRIGVTFEP